MWFQFIHSTNIWVPPVHQVLPGTVPSTKDTIECKSSCSQFLVELDANQINLQAKLRCQPNKMSALVSAVKGRHPRAWGCGLVREVMGGALEEVKLELWSWRWVNGKRRAGSRWLGHASFQLCPDTERTRSPWFWRGWSGIPYPSDFRAHLFFLHLHISKIKV